MLHTTMIIQPFKPPSYFDYCIDDDGITLLLRFYIYGKLIVKMHLQLTCIDI